MNQLLVCNVTVLFCSFKMFLSGVNLTNILRKAFTRANPKSTKMTVKSSILFALLGSTCLKASRKMLVNLTPGAYQMSSANSGKKMLTVDVNKLFRKQRRMRANNSSNNKSNLRVEKPKKRDESAIVRSCCC